MQEVLFFKFDCEWLCNFVRQRVYWEGMPFLDGIAVLKDTFGVDDDVALSILTGTKKIVGINEGELVDDDKHEDYLQYIARTEKATAFSKLEKDVDLHPSNSTKRKTTIERLPIILKLTRDWTGMKKRGENL